MSGDFLSERSCPSCDGSLDSISDCFRGPVSAIDNFDEVEAYLRDQGVISDDEYDLYADDYSREEYETALDSSDHEPRDGPFITDNIVCTETWCSDCAFSERTYTPPEAVAEQLTAALTG